MTITIETSNIHEIEQLLKLLKVLDIKGVKIQDSVDKTAPTITKGDKSIDPEGLFGIWQNHPRTIEEIRSAAWERNWNS